ncbi:MAG: hypothetical protein WDM81_09185 [Rhizomicrobium sp.]
MRRDKFPHDELQRVARHRQGDLDLAQRTFEPVEMLVLVHQQTIIDAADFIHRVTELEPAILDVHAGAAVAHIAPPST